MQYIIQEQRDMHELSVAQNIFDIVRQSVPKGELSDVRIVRLKVGTFSGVVADSLDFCFSAISAETPLAKAHLEFEHIPFVVKCHHCQKTFENEMGFVVCPECGGVETVVLAGRELQVVEIELENEKDEKA
jgi:hydrogenase nickel incorporation protein HypA/HybF